jgi:TP901 family phage tail tape measure protein
VALRTVGVRLTADIANYVSNMRKAEQTTKSFGQSLSQRAAAGKLDEVAGAAGKMGLGLAAGFAFAVKSAADFDKQMSAVSAATHANVQTMGQLRAAALQAGKDTQYSATEAAKGVTELGKAGVSSADILGGGLKGALALAAAGQMDVGAAAETAASAMTQFGLSGDKVPHIADLLAAAAGKAQGSVHDLGYALSQSGLVASQTGLSIEDATGTLAAFASAGLIGSDAGTSFKTMLLALQNPTAGTEKLMNKMGISAYDASGQFVGITKFAGILQDQLKDLTPEIRQATLAQIFGSDAVRGATVLYNQGAGGIQKWIDKTNEAGYAASTAAKLTDNLSGDMERLKSSLETLAIEGGSGANSGLRVLTKGLNGLVDGFASMPPVVGGTITVLAGLGAALLLGGAAWVKYRSLIAKVNAELIATGPTGEKAAAGLSKASKAAGIAGAAFLGMEVVGAVFDRFGPAAANVDKLSASLDNFSNTGKVSGELAATFGADLSGLHDSAQTAISGVGGFTGAVNDLGNTLRTNSISDWLASITGTTSINKATSDMAAYDAALTQVMTTSGDAKKASQLWNSALQQSGLDTGQLAKVLPDAYKKVGELNTAADKVTTALHAVGKASTGAAKKQGEYKTATDLAAGAARGEAAALVKLSSQLTAQVNPVYGLLDAEKALKTAQDKATEAIKNHGKHSTAAKNATHELALAAIDLQGKAGALGDKFNGKLTPAMKTTLKAAGLTKTEIDIVSGAFRTAKKDADKYDGNYKANVTAPGAKQSKTDIDHAYTAANHFAGPYKANLSTPGAKQSETAAARAWAQAKGFDGNYNAHVTTTGVPKVRQALSGLMLMQQALKKGVSASAIAATNKNVAQGFSDGGYTGSGPRTQPAGIVHADEYVVNSPSRQRFESAHPGALDHINRTGQMPGYDGGGRVALPYRVTAAMTRIPSKNEAILAVGGYAGGGSLGAWIRQAMALTGVPASWGGPLRTLIMRESGGNPNAINLWDSNAKAGHPSQGLMQTIPSTFSHYRLRSLPNSITNPIANIVAGIRYIESRYGSIFRVQQANANLPPKGYAHGGVLNEPVFGVGASGRRYTFAENGPERVVPNWQSEGGRSGGSTTIEFHNHAPIGSQYELETWLTGAFNNLQRKGRVS